MVPLFIKFTFIDLIDILLVAFILYQLYRLVKGTVAINIVIGIVVIYLIWLVVKFLNMSLLSTILGAFISVGVIAFVVVFQQEIRKFLLLLGDSDFVKKYFGIDRYLRQDAMATSNNTLRDIARACRNMAQTNTGALIVFTTRSELVTYIQSGDVLNADVSHLLIESVFFKNSPMHDGAMIIIGDKIKAARCVLPVDDKIVLPPHLGLRHRAALSMSSETETSVIVVSEEKGTISLAISGELKYGISHEVLFALLKNEYLPEYIAQ
jgi:diadenylate cyclase